MTINKAFGFEIGRQRLSTVTPLNQGGVITRGRAQLDLAGGIPKDYFINSFDILLQFRLVLASGSTSGTLAANAPFNFVERFEVSGNHKVFGDWTRYLLQGDHTYVKTRIETGFQNLASSSPALAASNGTYDVSVNYHINFVPPNIRPEERLFFLLDAPLWNSLNLYVDFGDWHDLLTALGTSQTASITGFNGVGTLPTMVVTREYAKLKADRFKLNAIPIKETYRSDKIETTVSDTLIDQINKGNFIRQLIFETGTIATGSPGAALVGDNFATLADNLVSRIRLKKDDIPQRDVEWTPNQQYENQRRGNTNGNLPTGWNIVDFAEDGTIATSYDTREIALNNQRFDFYADVPSGATGQRVHLITTELAGIPVFK